MVASGALVIFVKTPGLSPIKTRLAAEIGAKAAAQFYTLALKATEALALEMTKRCSSLKVYWAVAEQEALTDSHWKSFPCLWQGEGSLGDRLSSVYNQVLERHDYACFIGADAPHLAPEWLETGILKTAQASLKQNFVMGPAEDGGFYFFGGGLPIEKKLWLNVEYSSDQTGEQLRNNLLGLGSFELLPPTFDIDTANDLTRYSAAGFIQDNLLLEQLELFELVQRGNIRLPGDAAKADF